jgi:hypothetical protein
MITPYGFGSRVELLFLGASALTARFARFHAFTQTSTARDRDCFRKSLHSECSAAVWQGCSGVQRHLQPSRAPYPLLR